MKWYQQQPFFFSGFLFLSLPVFTSTGMKLRTPKRTSLPACFRPRPAQSSQRLIPHPACFWRWWSGAWFWGGCPGNPSGWSLPPNGPIRGRFCCPLGWRGISLAPWAPLGSGTRLSRTRCCRRTVMGATVRVCWLCRRRGRSNRPRGRMRRLNS